jgi:hypothetical protein
MIAVNVEKGMIAAIVEKEGMIAVIKKKRIAISKNYL